MNKVRNDASVPQVTEEIMAVLKEGDPRLARLQENASSLSQLSTQTVFSMLDHLTQWSRHKLQSMSTNKRSGKHAREQPPPQTMGVFKRYKRLEANKNDFCNVLLHPLWLHAVKLSVQCYLCFRR